MRQKVRHLGLVVVDRKKKIVCSTTTTVQLVLPEELFSVEEALKKLVAAMNALACQGVLLKNKPESKVPV